MRPTAGRWNLIGAVIAVLVLATVLVTTALGTPGYRAAEIDLDDASLWVGGTSIDIAGDARSRVGRANLETPELEARVDVEGLTAIFQDGDDVLLAGASLLRIEPGTDEPASDSSFKLPSEHRIGMGGGTAAVLDTESGAIWAATPDEIVTREIGSRPSTELPDGERDALLVVGGRGAVIAYGPGSDSVRVLGSDGTRRDLELAAPVGDADAEQSGSGDPAAAVDSAIATGTVQLSAIGDLPVLLDSRAATLTIGEREPVELPEDIVDPLLQQPGPAGPLVLISDGSGLWGVPVDGGAPRRVVPADADLVDVGAGGTAAARPISDGTCHHGTWMLQQKLHLQRVCPGASHLDASGAIDHSAVAVDTRSQIVMRGNGGRVAANNVENGYAWTLDLDGEVRQIGNWDETDEDDDPVESDEQRFEEPEDEDCDVDADAPLQIDAQEMGARATMPALLHVLADASKVRSASCTVLSVTKAEASGDASVDIVGDGDVLQFTAQAPGTHTVAFTVTDARTATSTEARLTVTVHPFDRESNTAPAIRSNGLATSVVAGRSVSYDVLSAAHDAEGDLLTLMDACVGRPGTGCLDVEPSRRDTADGVIRHQSDGWVRYESSPRASATRVVAFLVRDQWGAETEGELHVEVLRPDDPGAVPVAHADRAVLVRGTSARIDPTANDVSPRGLALHLGALRNLRAPDGVGAAVQARVAATGEGNEVEIPGDLPAGTYLYDYEVSDAGSEAVHGRIRVDVVEEDPDRRPIAVRDEAVLHQKEPLLLDLTRNDIDPSGDVLVVRSVAGTTTPEAAPTVQLLRDRTTVRITAHDGFDGDDDPQLVQYLVSNGRGGDGGEPVMGVIVIRPFPSSDTQEPLPRDDGPIEVKPGGLVSIPVVDNDISPQGRPLRVTDVHGLDPERGEAFIGANEVRFVAPAVGGPTGSVVFKYDVADEAGRKATADITVEVVDPERANRAPRSYDLLARTFTGHPVDIEVPLMSADPDGDVVWIAGITEQPDHGQVEIGPRGFLYTPEADGDSTGTATFGFHLTDGESWSESTVRVGVVAPPVEVSAPVVTPIPVQIGVGESRAVPVLSEPYVTTLTSGVTLVENEATSERSASPTSPHVGSIEIADDGRSIIYTAPDSIGAQDQVTTAFRYAVVDAQGRESRNSVLVTIGSEEVDIAPIAEDDILQPARAGDEVVVEVLSNDTDPRTGSNVGLTAELIDGSGEPDELRFEDGVARFQMTRRSVRFRYELHARSTAKTSEGVVVVPVDLSVRCEPFEVPIKAGGTATVEIDDHCTAPPDRDIAVLPPRSTQKFAAVNPTARGFELAVGDLAKGRYPITYAVCLADECQNTTIEYQAFAVVDGANHPPILTAPEMHVPAGGTTVVDLRKWIEDPNRGDEEAVRFTPKRATVGRGRVAASLAADGKLTLEAPPRSYLDGNGGGVLEVSFTDGDRGGDAVGEVRIVVDATDAEEISAADDSATVIFGREDTYAIPILSNDDDPAGAVTDLDVAVSQPSAQVSGARPGTVTWNGDAAVFTPASGYGGQAMFTYTVTDPGDRRRSDTASVVVEVIGTPGRAGTPRAEGLQDGRIPLAWGPADAKGGTIERYEIRCQVAATGAACPAGVLTEARGGTSVVIEGLRNGTAYRFGVRAHNEAGRSSAGPDDGWSEWSEPMAPDRVPTVSIGQVGVFGPFGPGERAQPDGVGGQLTIRWSGTSEGSPITAYEIQVGAMAPILVPVGSLSDPAAPSWVVDGLANGVSHTVRVRARNEAGEGPWAEGAGTPQRPPEGVRVTEVRSGSGTIGLSWTWPAAADTAAPEGFEIEAIRSGRTRLVEGATTSADFDFPNGTEEQFRVRARNGAGWGGWGEPSAVQRAVGRPAAPTATLAQTADSGTIAFTITPAGDGGSPITTYKLTVGGRSFALAAAGGTAQHAGGFVDGTVYTGGTIVACSHHEVERCSDAGTVSGSARPFSAPAAVPAPDWDWVGNTIGWSWGEPAHTSGTTLSYEVSEDGGTSWTPTAVRSHSTTVDCLATDRSVQVRAVSTWGEHQQVGPSTSITATRATPSCTFAIELGDPVPDGTRGCTGPDCHDLRLVHSGLPAGTFRFECEAVDGSVHGVDFTVPYGPVSGACAATPGSTISYRVSNPDATFDTGWATQTLP